MKMELTSLNLTSIAWAVILWVTISWAVREKVVRRMRRVPPGPTSLPLIGNLHNLSSEPHKALAELARAHGPLMFLRLGFMKTAVVSSSEVARQVLQKKDSSFSSRMVPHSICSPHHRHHDLSMSLIAVGPRWRTLRKIANTLLFSSKILDANQGTRMNKIKGMVSYVDGCREAGVVVNMGQTVFDCSLNLLSNTFFSMDLADPNSELSREFKQLSWGIVRDMAKPNLPDFFPLFNMLDPQGLRRRMTAQMTQVFTIFDQIIQQRLASYSTTAPKTDDVLDALINICRQKSEDFELRQIRHLLFDLFIAGTETTSSTIEWAMAELLHDPTKLKIAQEEIRGVVGRGNFVKEEDHTSLPYLQAVLNETLRLHPPLPLLVPRKADSDTEVNGYIIPKDSQVLVNVWAMGRDPSLWRNPNTFEPERFLTSGIDYKGNYFELLPFGSGRRICVGLPLATRMLPLLLGNLINFFNWKLEDGVLPEALNMDEKFGIALQKATPLFAIPLSA